MTAEEQLAGQTVALLALVIVALLVVGTNPFALLFVPAAALGFGCHNTSARRSRCGSLFALGSGPAIVVLSLAWRYGPARRTLVLVLLVVVGYVKTTPVVIALAGAAAASQLATIAAGRYAPYPDVQERRRRGPIRAVIRLIVLNVLNARDRRTETRVARAGGS